MTTTLQTTHGQSAFAGTLRRLIWVGPLAMLAASAASLGLYYAAGSLFPEVTAWAGAGPAQIIGASVVYLLIGAVVFLATARWSPRPARHYGVAASLGLLLSLGLPIAAGFGFGTAGAPAASTATVITLSLMHIVAYAISVPLFTRLALD